MPAKKLSTVDALKRGMGTSPAAEDRQHVDDLPPAPQLPPRPEKPVRFTLDLDQPLHRFLQQSAAQAGAGVKASHVMRALLDELRDDPQLAARVQARAQARAWQVGTPRHHR